MDLRLPALQTAPERRPRHSPPSSSKAPELRRCRSPPLSSLALLSRTSRRLRSLLKIWATNIQIRKISCSPPNGLAPAGAPNGAGAAAAPLAAVVVVGAGAAATPPAAVVGAVEPNKMPPVFVAENELLINITTRNFILTSKWTCACRRSKRRRSGGRATRRRHRRRRRSCDGAARHRCRHWRC